MKEVPDVFFSRSLPAYLSHSYPLPCSPSRERKMLSTGDAFNAVKQINDESRSLRNLCYGMTFANRERCICFDVSFPRWGNFMNEISFSFCLLWIVVYFFRQKLLQANVLNVEFLRKLRREDLIFFKLFFFKLFIDKKLIYIYTYISYSHCKLLNNSKSIVVIANFEYIMEN